MVVCLFWKVESEGCGSAIKHLTSMYEWGFNFWSLALGENKIRKEKRWKSLVHPLGFDPWAEYQCADRLVHRLLKRWKDIAVCKFSGTSHRGEWELAAIVFLPLPIFLALRDLDWKSSGLSLRTSYWGTVNTYSDEDRPLFSPLQGKQPCDLAAETWRFRTWGEQG